MARFKTKVPPRNQKGSRPSYGLIVPSRYDDDQLLYASAKQNAINQINETFLPVWHVTYMRYSEWWEVLGRINEAAQLATGKKLSQRLRELRGEMTTKARAYTDILQERKKIADDKRGAQDVIDGVMHLQARYSDCIGDIIDRDGKGGGKKLVALHEGELRNTFQVFIPDIDVGGAPEGAQAKTKALLDLVEIIRADKPDIGRVTLMDTIIKRLSKKRNRTPSQTKLFHHLKPMNDTERIAFIVRTCGRYGVEIP